jgi:hypothetical protein
MQCSIAIDMDIADSGDLQRIKYRLAQLVAELAFEPSANFLSITHEPCR